MTEIVRILVGLSTCPHCTKFRIDYQTVIGAALGLTKCVLFIGVSVSVTVRTTRHYDVTDYVRCVQKYNLSYL